jgi:hypothetical protein
VAAFLVPSPCIADGLRAFRPGLKDTRHVEAENVAIQYRWAEKENERLTQGCLEAGRVMKTRVADERPRCGHAHCRGVCF